MNPRRASLVSTDARQRMLTAASALASARDLGEVSAGLCAAVFDVIDCVRTYCVFYDAEDGVLFTESPDAREFELGGIVGAAVTTKGPIHAGSASNHLSYDANIDDPAGTGRERLIVQPIAGAGSEVHAALVAVVAEDQPFHVSMLATLQELARYAAPAVQHVANVLDEAQPLGSKVGIFRREAVDEHGARRRRGDIVRITPHWVAPVSWLVFAMIGAVGVFFAVGSVNRYSAGPGVVRAGNRTSVVSREAGTLTAIEVEPGQRVEQGTVVARLDDADIRGQVERLQAQLLAELRAHMHDLDGERAPSSLASLRAQLEEARSRAAQREIRAPQSGSVVDLRSAIGQPLRPGDVVLTMSSSDAAMEVVALLPGDDRPQIEPGMRLRFDIPGYRQEPQWCRIVEVGDSIVGPREAARQLGPEAGDVVKAAGPSIIVRATLPSATFAASGQAYAYHDGMYGDVEVRLRKESLVEALMPGVVEALQ